MEKSVLLTIITPVFNGSAFLKACLENVISQWTIGIEHLIVDGGSQDGSLDILESYAAQFPHIRFVSEKDKGQSDAMNKGIHMAKGTWISFLNVDDFYEPNILPSILQKIEKAGSKPCLLTGNLKVWNEKGELLSTNRPAHMTLPKMLADICEWPYNPSAYFYPKSLHEIIGFFPEEEHFAMDYDFFFRLMLAKIPIHYHNEIWGNFRLLPDAKTGKDQAGNESYKRAEILRKKYLNQAVKAVKLETAFLKIAWALRNKTIGLRKKLSGNS